MFARVLIAAAGAIVVTGALLLTMDSLTSLFEDERGERVFRITDILDKPEPGRPERPQPGARQPDRQDGEATSLDASIPIEAPTPAEAEALTVPAPEIALPTILPD